MKIYAGLHGDMQKPRIKSRGGNISEAMAKTVKIANITPQIVGTTAISEVARAATNAAIRAQTLKAGDLIALLRSNP